MIGRLELGGGTLGLTHVPGRDQPFAQDLAAWAEFRPALVVSLTELTEIDPARIASALSAQGVAHRHFPIRDYDIPPDGADWRGLRAAMSATLTGGGRVLVHCHGGRGRSGMIALALMIALGESPERALPRLRAARPGAVETPAQEAWARQNAAR